MTTTPSTHSGRSGMRTLALDIAVPLGTFFALRDGLGAGLVLSLAVSSVVPVVRTCWSAARDRHLNPLAVLMLLANLAGIAASLVSGDARFALAKDAGISSVIAAVLLVSVVRGRPALTAGLHTWVVRGDAARAVQWDRVAGTATFRRHERRFTLAWGTVLLADCVVRIVGAYTVPVTTMAWLSTVVTLTGLGLAAVVGGIVGAGPLTALVDAARDDLPATPAVPASAMAIAA